MKGREVNHLKFSLKNGPPIIRHQQNPKDAGSRIIENKWGYRRFPIFSHYGGSYFPAETYHIFPNPAGQRLHLLNLT